MLKLRSLPLRTRAIKGSPLEYCQSRLWFCMLHHLPFSGMYVGCRASVKGFETKISNKGGNTSRWGNTSPFLLSLELVTRFLFFACCFVLVLFFANCTSDGNQNVHFLLVFAFVKVHTLFSVQATVR